MPRRPMPRPDRAPSKSKRPMPRPSTREEREAGERGNRQPGDMTRREMEAGMKKGGKVGKMAYGGKMKAKKMAKGGMCRGMGAASRGGKYKSS